MTSNAFDQILATNAANRFTAHGTRLAKKVPTEAKEAMPGVAPTRVDIIVSPGKGAFYFNVAKRAINDIECVSGVLGAFASIFTTAGLKDAALNIQIEAVPQEIRDWEAVFGVVSNNPTECIVHYGQNKKREFKIPFTILGFEAIDIVKVVTLLICCVAKETTDQNATYLDSRLTAMNKQHPTQWTSDTNNPSLIEYFGLTKDVRSMIFKQFARNIAARRALIYCVAKWEYYALNDAGALVMSQFRLLAGHGLTQFLFARNLMSAHFPVVMKMFPQAKTELPDLLSMMDIYEGMPYHVQRYGKIAERDGYRINTAQKVAHLYTIQAKLLAKNDATAKNLNIPDICKNNAEFMAKVEEFVEGLSADTEEEQQ